MTTISKILILVIVIKAMLIPQPLQEGRNHFKEKINAEVSAYTASIEETDSTPTITASGTTTTKNRTIACPSRYEFGTKVRVKGKQYICEDRMNKRYRHGNYFDIFLEEKEDAFEFGRQQLTVYIY